MNTLYLILIAVCIAEIILISMIKIQNKYLSKIETQKVSRQVAIIFMILLPIGIIFMFIEYMIIGIRKFRNSEFLKKPF